MNHVSFFTAIITHWIDSILTYCVDESVDEHHLPKILFAATHADSYTKVSEKTKMHYWS